jgi:hypothetical protein
MFQCPSLLDDLGDYSELWGPFINRRSLCLPFLEVCSIVPVVASVPWLVKEQVRMQG